VSQSALKTYLDTIAQAEIDAAISAAGGWPLRPIAAGSRIKSQPSEPVEAETAA